MPKIEMYSTPWCPYCIAAKRLLQKKGAAYEDTDVSGDAEARADDDATRRRALFCAADIH